MKNKRVKQSLVWAVVILWYLCLLGLSQTRPTLEELKALKSIKGKIQGSIVWSTLRHGTWQIYRMKADGTGKVRLTEDGEENHQPVWSPDGDWIYFQRNEDIYRMHSDGSDSQLVVEQGFSFDISGDGAKIIYVTKGQDKYSIVLRDIEEGKTEEIIPARTPQFDGKSLMYPTLSPDGRWLAFSSDYPRSWTIHMVRIDGSHPFQFSGGCMPQFNQDGSTVVWVSRGHNLYLGAPDGKDQRSFESSIPGRPHSYFPKWSNDGEYIVFASSPHRSRTTGDYEIYIKPVKRGKAIRLTFDPRSDIWPDLFISEKD